MCSLVFLFLLLLLVSVSLFCAVLLPSVCVCVAVVLSCCVVRRGLVWCAVACPALLCSGVSVLCLCACSSECVVMSVLVSCGASSVSDDQDRLLEGPLEPNASDSSDTLPCKVPNNGFQLALGVQLASRFPIQVEK